MDRHGVECSELDPRVATMIVAAGCEIDEETARRYGLIPAEEEAAPAAEDVEAPAASLDEAETAAKPKPAAKGKKGKK